MEDLFLEELGCRRLRHCSRRPMTFANVTKMTRISKTPTVMIIANSQVSRVSSSGGLPSSGGRICK